MRKVKYILLSAIPTVVYLIVSIILSALFMIVFVVLQAIQHTSEFVELSDEELMSIFLSEATMPITIAVDIFIFIFGLLIFKKAMRDESFGFSEKPFPDYTLPGVIMISIGMYAVISLLLGIMGMLIPDAIEAYSELIESSGLGDVTLISTFGAVICAPFCEELIFRGMTMKILNDGDVSFLAANIIQAALFGIMHMNLVQGIYAFLLGLVLGYFYIRTGSLWASILAHMIFNFMGTCVNKVLIIFENQLWFIAMAMLMCLVSLLAGIFFMKLRRRNYKLSARVRKNKDDIEIF